MKIEIIHFEELKESRELLEAREPNFIVFFILFLLVLFFVAILWMWFSEVDIVVKANGIVRPFKSVSVIRNVQAGNIKKLLYREGQKVNRGDILYVLDSSNLKIREAGIVEEIKRIEEEIAFLKRLEESIRKGTNLFKNEEEEFFNRYLLFEFNIEQLKLKYRETRRRYLQEKSLSPDLVIKQKLKELEAELLNSELNLKKFESQTLVDINREIETKRERLFILENQLKDLKDKLIFCSVYAPIGGYIQVLQNFNEGDYLPQGIEVLKIIPASDQVYKIDLTVNNRDISEIKIGQKVNFRFLALPFKEYGALEGQITRISKDAMLSNDNNLSYRVEGLAKEKILFDRNGRPKEIKPGMIVEARIVVRKKKVLYILLEKLNFLN